VPLDPVEVLEDVRDVATIVLEAGKAHALAHLLAEVGQVGLDLLRVRLEKRFTADRIEIVDPV
jgi:hypothetical protein